MRDIDEIRAVLDSSGADAPDPGLAWHRVRSGDEGEYLRHLAGQPEQDEWSYEANWAFVTQESRNIGMWRKLGDAWWWGVIRYDESPFVFVFPPAGTAVYGAKEIRAVNQELRELTGRRVVFRKVDALNYALLLRIGNTRTVPVDLFTDARDVPEDVRPQVVVDVKASAERVGPAYVKTRNQVRRFVEDNSPAVASLSPENRWGVARVVARWNTEGRAHFERNSATDLEAEPANEGAYTIFADVFADRVDNQQYFGRLVSVGDEPIGFTFAGRTSETTAALYSCLSLTHVRGATEFLLGCLLDDLRAADVLFLNMGGSETDGLFRFKVKYSVAGLRPTYDIELV